MASPQLLLERDGRVAILTVNRPEARNAMTFEMYEALHDACERLDRDDEVRVVILTGAGDRAFVSGTDIRQFLDVKTKEDVLGYEERVGRVIRRLWSMTKPTIAMVRGDATGGGLFMSLACDLRLAAPHARFGAPVARTLGNFVARTAVMLLVSTVGPVRARELVLTARLLDAEEARAIGLVTRIHPLADLEPKTRELAHEMATLAPLTQRAAKEATRRFLTLQTRALELDDLVLSCFLSEDFREGVRAFLEKRPARWQGR